METSEKYPTQILKEKFRPIRDILKSYNVSEKFIMSLVRENKVMYALMKDPVGSKRIPHVNFEQLKCYMEGEE